MYSWWFDNCIHYGMITIISPVTICSYTKLLQYYWPYSLCCTFHLHGLFLFNWRFVPLNPLHLFHRHMHPSPFWQPLVCSLYSWTISRIFDHFTLSNTYIELKKKFHEIIFILPTLKACCFLLCCFFWNASSSLLNWLVLICRVLFVESSLGF